MVLGAYATSELGRQMNVPMLAQVSNAASLIRPSLRR